jgi:uncharacterized protein (TIGR03437 family)
MTRVFLALRLATILLVQDAIWGQQAPPSYDFVTNGIREAHVDSVNGTTRLIINGQPVPPLLFMDQEDFQERLQFLAPQVQDAAAHGIHLFQISVNDWPWDNQGIAPLDFSATDQIIDNVIKGDPQAAVLLRVDVAPGPGWKPPVAPTPDDYVLYADGQTIDAYHISIASDIFYNGFLTSVPHLVEHYETSSYAARVLGYVIMSQNTGEWFPVDIWRGPDYSPVNTRAFRVWLQTKYGTDAALSNAWGKAATISNAQVPQPQPGRFPIVNYWDVTNSGPLIDTFYKLPDEQNWVDYSAYTSDIFSQRILDAAKVVRAATGGKRLIGVYNGYLVALPTSFNGHLRFDRLLASPDLDFFCAGNTFFDRLAGGVGGAPSIVDTVIAHAKLWFNEDDLYTYLSAESIFPPLPNSSPPTADLTETVDVLERELAAVLIHRAGTWWMDISENGTFNDPAMWAPMSDGLPLYNELYANPQPYRPDVALIIDRSSILFQKNDAVVTTAQRVLLQIALAKTGVAYATYYLDDFLDGTLPPCKVYIFANSFYLTDGQIANIQSRLNAEGATAIWQYAPGFLGPNGPDVNRSSTLTGIQLSQLDGYGYTDGAGLMAGYSWGLNSMTLLTPRLIVNDPDAEVLGRYRSDKLISSARKKVGNFESIFIGESAIGDVAKIGADRNGWPADPLRTMLETTGVHIWSTAGDVVFTDGRLLVVHPAAAGPDSISLPTGVSAVPLRPGSGQTPSTGTLNVTFSRVGETQWFRLFNPQASSVSAAAYTPSLAPESIASAFGSDLATSAMQVITLPLPTIFNGTTVKVRDSAGVERLAPLFYVSLTQVNYEIPAGTAAGPALVTITSGDGAVTSGNVTITAVAPALFSANADGGGPAAGFAIHVKPDASQNYEPLAVRDPTSHKEVFAPIDLGPADERVFLSLAGSGIRGRSALANVAATIGDAAVPVTYAGAQSVYVGLDQINLGPLPRSLIGAGVVKIVLTVDGQKANTLEMQIK